MNLPEAKIAGSDGQLVWGEKVVVPDLSYLTNVDLPPVLDLRDTRGVVSFLEPLLSEQKIRDPKYLGAFLFGSVARETATNGSDIDLLHVYNGNQGMLGVVEVRLDAVLGLYGVKATQLRKTIALEEVLERGSVWFRGDLFLDKHSMPLLLDPVLVEIIKKSTDYQIKEPNVNYPGKTPSTETDPHLLKTCQTGTLIPSWGKPSLLKPL